MRFTNVILAVALICVGLWSTAAAAPQLIDYQGFLKTSGGTPVTSTLSMTFTIYTAVTGGSSKWSETQSSVTVTGGLFNVTLGSNTAIPDTVFNGDDRYLEISIGGSALSPRTRIASSAYGQRVETIDGATGGTLWSDLIVPRILIGSGNYVSGNYSYSAGYGDSVIGNYSAVAGGYNNTVFGDYAFVVGDNNYARDHSSVLGGQNNTSHGYFSSIGGGIDNRTGNTAAFVGGGEYDTASSNYSSVLGGYNNRAKYDYASVGGGRDNLASAYGATVGGGAGNAASGTGDNVTGGLSNLATGGSATVAGGAGNAAKGYGSLAAGTLAKANHNNSIVLAANSTNGADPSDSVMSGGAAQIVLRADGGVYFTNTRGTASYNSTRLINTSTGAYLSSGGTWTNASDRALKENLSAADGEKTLELLASLPIYTWNYIADDDATKHIGPMAQDFYRIFGLGNDDKSISTIDPSGVALAAIQELYRVQRQLEAKVSELTTMQKELADLRTLVRLLSEKTDLANDNGVLVSATNAQPLAIKSEGK